MSAAAAAGRIARVASKYIHGKRKRNGTSGRGVTFEHDRQRIYRKKRMPWKKKRRWRRFIRKVNAVDERELGTRTVVNNKTVTPVNVTLPNTQHVFGVTLYGQESSDSFNNDLRNIQTLENTADPTSAAGVNIGSGTKFMFHSGVLDMTIRNVTQVYNDVGVPSLSTDGTLEIDVYEITSGVQWDFNGAAIGEIVDAFTDGSGETKVLNGGTNGVDISDRGATPWDIPQTLSKYRMKIMKKTKFRISVGNTFTYQVRDPRRRVTVKSRLAENIGANKPGWTKHLMFIAKLVPGLTLGTNEGEYGIRLSYGITRKYMYKIEGANQPRDRYQPST